MQRTIRLLPHEVASGPFNMAGDEVLLISAAQGVASLRFYGWREATVSLGYFQAASARQGAIAVLPFVRRPSGGGMLVHHHELTYALALPAAHLRQTPGSWLVRMHQVIARALRELGVEVRQEGQCAPAPDEALCFRRWSCGDLTLAGHKVVGSAQRKQRQCLLQHGAVLLQASPVASELKGIGDLCDTRIATGELEAAIALALGTETAWQIAEGTWTATETEVRELVATRYGRQVWNEKR